MDGEDALRVYVAMFSAWAHVQASRGRKKCCRIGVGAVLRNLKAEIPENGVGPHISARRQAAQIVESNCRICGRCSPEQLAGAE